MMTMYLMIIFSTLTFNLLKKKLLYLQNLILINFLIFLIFNKITFFNKKISWNFFIDYYSFFLILLTLWILSLMFMSMNKMKFKKIYAINLMIMLMTLILTFNSINYFMFYLFFEVSMIPTLFLIIGWGKQFERIEAGIYMILYTLTASLPMMIILFKIYVTMNSLNMIMLNNMNIINNFYSYIYLILAFLVKLPMFFFHLWLPKAHVEAPISGSMILAAIMLKLGSYGILRIMLIMEKMCLKFNYLIMMFSLLGSMYISIICLKQTDMKMLIAYSSIVHMGLTIASLMTMNSWGYKGSLIMMISHGLCSSGLFCLININYERLKSRSMIINKGLMNILPSMSLFWFMMSIFNMASPPSLNIFSEILMINSLLMWNTIPILIIMIMSMTNVIYMMYFYSSSQHGSIYKNINTFMFINIREFLLMILHLLPLMYLFTMF
uniref:NADH-ubiquinone oxidoreductase chain 4 n=1 Tax=Figites sp. ZJUH 20220010 TaxID=2995277 RepID=A0A9E8G7F4_9HYME|nr:NADH dehydrogenase subunit 4 [Figites sp. ZJUH 20220010]